MRRNRRLPVDKQARIDHQLFSTVNTKLTTMDIDREKYEDPADLALELEISRERQSDPFRPLVLSLLHEARERAARRDQERAREGEEKQPAQGNGNAKP